MIRLDALQTKAQFSICYSQFLYQKRLHIRFTKSTVSNIDLLWHGDWVYRIRADLEP